MGCLLWIQITIYVIPQFLECSLVLDCIIMASNFTLNEVYLNLPATYGASVIMNIWRKLIVLWKGCTALVCTSHMKFCWEYFWLGFRKDDFSQHMFFNFVNHQFWLTHFSMEQILLHIRHRLYLITMKIGTYIEKDGLRFFSSKLPWKTFSIENGERSFSNLY